MWYKSKSLCSSKGVIPWPLLNVFLYGDWNVQWDARVFEGRNKLLVKCCESFHSCTTVFSWKVLQWFVFTVLVAIFLIEPSLLSWPKAIKLGHYYYILDLLLTSKNDHTDEHKGLMVAKLTFVEWNLAILWCKLYVCCKPIAIWELLGLMLIFWYFSCLCISLK